jgi:hypothetical protein
MYSEHHRVYVEKAERIVNACLAVNRMVGGLSVWDARTLRTPAYFAGGEVLQVLTRGSAYARASQSPNRQRLVRSTPWNEVVLGIL